MAILHASAAIASTVQPCVKKATGISTVAVAALCVVVYGKGLLGVPRSFAIAAQLIFFIVAAFTYWPGFGLKHEQKIVLSAGMTTRNVGAAMAPLFSIAEIDQRAMIMVVLRLPIMVMVALLTTKWLGRSMQARDS